MGVFTQSFQPFQPFQPKARKRVSSLAAITTACSFELALACLSYLLRTITWAADAAAADDDDDDSWNLLETKLQSFWIKIWLELHWIEMKMLQVNW